MMWSIHRVPKRAGFGPFHNPAKSFANFFADLVDKRSGISAYVHEDNPFGRRGNEFTFYTSTFDQFRKRGLRYRKMASGPSCYASVCRIRYPKYVPYLEVSSENGEKRWPIRQQVRHD